MDEHLTRQALHFTLPTPRTRLIGRAAEVAAARSLLLEQAAPLLTLTGAGGSGKTRLALAVAHDVADQFADGLIFVDLAPVGDPALVTATVISALDAVSATDGNKTPDPIQRLRHTQTLVVLDNCEHLLPAVADFVASLLVACPAVQVLATSRASLRLRGEQEAPVNPLSVPSPDETAFEILAANDAVRLFSERAAAVLPSFCLDKDNAAAVATLCRRVDGLPLAIELVAAQSKLLPPTEMLTQLGDRLHLLPNARDAPARQRTIHDTIAWSYDLLGPDAQWLFRRLAVFSGGWTLEAAAAVSGLALPEVLARVNALVDQSLVVGRLGIEDQPTRFTMLETIREFGLDRLKARGEDGDMRDRHAAFFRDLIVTKLDLYRAKRGERSWFARAVAEESNLRQALAWLVTRCDGLALHELSCALQEFWTSRAQLTEGLRWLEQALQVQAGVPLVVRARTLREVAALMIRQGEYVAAEPLIAESLHLARDSGDPLLLYSALQTRGVLAERQGDLARAQAWLEESLRVGRAERTDPAGGKVALGGTLLLLGGVARKSGDVVAARAWMRQSIAESRQRGRFWTLASALGALGVLQALDGELKEAAATLAEALAIHWWQGDTTVMTRALRGFAVVAAATGKGMQAAQLLGAAEAIDERTASTSRAAERDREVIARCLARLDARFAPSEQDILRATGSALTISQAVALARDVAMPVLGADRVAQIWQGVGAPDPSPVPMFDVRGLDLPPAPTRDILGQSLTFREQEVLALLCQRLTDAEIAERIFVSPRTASRHVGSIISKLGAANRRDAAAIAARNNLISSTLTRL